MKLFLLAIVTVASTSSFAEVKFDGNTLKNQPCVVRILSDIQTTKGLKKLVVVEDAGGPFIGQSSLMVDMDGTGAHFRSVETVQRGSVVYNNLFISEDGKTMSYTSDLMMKSGKSESILECSSVK